MLDTLKFSILKRINLFENFKSFKGIALINDKKHIVAYTVDKLFVFDLLDGKMVNEPSTQSTKIDFIVSSPKGCKFFTEDLGNNSVKIWDASNLKIIDSLIGNISSNFGHAINHVGARLVDGTPEGNLLLWDLEKVTLLSNLRMEKSAGEFETHSGTNGKFSFSPNGRLVLSSGFGSLNFWDVESEV